MKYSLNNAQVRFSNGENLKYIFFWGHQPSKDGSITKTCLSQWWECAFEVDGVLYNSAEQYMMAEKAKLFGDTEVREQILQAKHPKQAKDLGRSVSGFDEEKWLENRYGIVVAGNQAKFSQNECLKEFLWQTDERVLVEASPHDKIWGIGLAANDTGVENPHNWRGLNLLGFALMEVRNRLG
jgi:hypothetical protein